MVWGGSQLFKYISVPLIEKTIVSPLLYLQWHFCHKSRLFSILGFCIIPLVCLPRANDTILMELYSKSWYPIGQAPLPGSSKKSYSFLVLCISTWVLESDYQVTHTYPFGNLIGTVLNLQITLGSTDSIQHCYLPIHEHNVSLQLLQVLKNVS